MQEVNGVIVNKLTLDQYRELKANNELQTNESYIITDIDEHLDNLIIYKESLDVNNPIILRGLADGIYSVYGYIKFNSNQSGISAIDPKALIIVGNSSTTTYVQIMGCDGNSTYQITDNSYNQTS